jgi:mannose/fructose/N-acetylgalactosamine-specific phosphotransferase system component IIC
MALLRSHTPHHSQFSRYSPLVTGFLGGAICAHVRMGELGSPPEIISLLLGAMTWGGLYARDPRIRAILPLIR